jgi:hypothetical protein
MEAKMSLALKQAKDSKGTRSLPFIKRELGIVRPSAISTKYRPESKSPARTFRDIDSAISNDHDTSLDSIGKYRARVDFFYQYRDIDKILRRKTAERSVSPGVTYIKELISRHKKPEPMRLFSMEDQTDIDVKEFGMGNTYASVFAKAIKNIQSIESLNLRNNRLGDNAVLQLISNLDPRRLKKLDLSYNQLGEKSLMAIARLIADDTTSIQYLSLEGIQLSTSSLIPICQALMNNSVMRVLNIAKNKLDERAGKPLGVMLDYNRYLEKLDLHWNSLRGNGAVALFEGLAENISLLELDISWNGLGRDNLSKTVTKMNDCFIKNNTLRHIDLSNNRFSTEESEILSRGIMQNHTVCGIHVEGNNCKVDAMGYLLSDKVCTQEDAAHYSERFIASKSRRRPKIPRNCWICEGWVDFEIAWNPANVVWNRRLKHFAMTKLAIQTEPIFIHLEIDGYSPWLLQPNNQGAYTALRAVPPGKTRFFFTYRGYAQISSSYRVEPPDERIDKTFTFYRDFTKSVSVVVVNYIEIEKGSRLTADPRPMNREYIPKPGDENVDFPEWSIENSIFKGYNNDHEVRITQGMTARCFEFDWEATRIQTIIKSSIELEATKRYLRSIYKEMYQYIRDVIVINTLQASVSIVLQVCS